MSDRTGDRHRQEHDCDRSQLGDIIKLDLLEVTEHQDTYIDQGRRSSGGRNDRSKRCDKHAAQEHHSGNQRGKTCTSARLYTGGRLNKSRDCGSTCNGSGNSTDRVGKECFLHLRHVTFLIEHLRTGRCTYEGTDSIKHIDQAESDDQGDDRKPSDLHKSLEVKAEKCRICHILKRRNERCSFQ